VANWWTQTVKKLARERNCGIWSLSNSLQRRFGARTQRDYSLNQGRGKGVCEIMTFTDITLEKVKESDV